MGENSQIVQDKADQELTFPVPWGVIAAKTWGDPCLRPVLLVHGIQDNAGSFDRLVPLLPRIFYYVGIDLPGHGKSTRFPKGIALDLIMYVSAINRVVRQLKWEKFYYVGHSLGGQLGVYYTAMYPSQVAKLVVLDAIMPKPLGGDDFIKHYVQMNQKLINLENKMLDRTPPSYTYEGALERMIANRPSPITREAAEALIKRSLKNGPEGYYFSTDQRLKFHLVVPVSLEQHLYNMSFIQCPFLLVATEILEKFIHSDFRKGVTRKTLQIFKKNKNFEMVVVDGYHDVHNTDPHVVAPHVSRFLTHQKSAL